jgi:hypothetical protein
MKLSTVLMGVGIGAFALVGCGGDNPGNDTASKSSFASALQGTWYQAVSAQGAEATNECVNIGDSAPYDSSLKFITTFKSGGNMTMVSKKYDTQDCDEDTLSSHVEYTLTYDIGNKVTDKDGDEAYEMDLVLTGVTFKKGSFDEIPSTPKNIYSTLKIKDNKLCGSEEAESKEERSHDISCNVYSLKRQ